jgi:hypothetical protein
MMRALVPREARHTRTTIAMNVAFDVRAMRVLRGVKSTPRSTRRRRAFAVETRRNAARGTGLHVLMASVEERAVRCRALKTPTGRDFIFVQTYSLTTLEVR